MYQNKHHRAVYFEINNGVVDTHSPSLGVLQKVADDMEINIQNTRTAIIVSFFIARCIIRST